METSSEAYTEPCQTSKMEVFAKMVNGFSFLSIFAKIFILDVWEDSEFASESSNDLAEKAPSQLFGRVLNPPLYIFSLNYSLFVY